MTPTEFTTMFPQFASKASAVPAALAEAALFVGEAWAELAPLGVGNYTAHKLVWDAVTAGELITAFDADVRAISKTVGRASLSRSAELLKLAWEDTFNYTKYGRRFRELQRLAGAGAISV
jgi:hypothetical protein